MDADPDGGSKMLPTHHSRKQSDTLPPINSSKRSIGMIFEPNFDTNKSGK